MNASSDTRMLIEIWEKPSKKYPQGRHKTIWASALYRRCHLLERQRSRPAEYA